MSNDILKTLPVRRGHFLLESGYHTDLWFNLDALFVSPEKIAPQVAALAELLRPYEISAVCGPLLGGAFVAHAVAARMGIRFYFTEPSPLQTDRELRDRPRLFAAEYQLPADLRRRVRDERIAIVDDIISAGSSVRATAAELEAAGASMPAVGAFLLLGNEAVEHFSTRGVPLVAVTRQDFNLWPPANCPLCRTGEPLENPATTTYIS
jgi:orotate phosphoribosyltransferase